MRPTRSCAVWGRSRAAGWLICSRSWATAALPAAPASPTERWSLHRAVRDLLDLLASRRPFVLAIDDLHWADPTTVELLDHLARRPPRGRHLLIVASRPDPQCDRLLAARRSSGPGAAVLLDLRPLDRAEADALLAPIDDPQRREQVYASSGGNPMLLAELARDRGQRRGAGRHRRCRRR